jgi:hypothetical protein
MFDLNEQKEQIDAATASQSERNFLAVFPFSRFTILSGAPIGISLANCLNNAPLYFTP